MDAVVYSNFRNNLKSYMKKVNDDYQPIMVVNKNPDEDIVVISKEAWNNMQETLDILSNQYLTNKIMTGMEEVKSGKFEEHHLIEV